MTKPEEPPRLELDRQSGAADLIEALRRDAPGPERMRRMARRLEPQFGPPAGPRGGGFFGGSFGKAASIGLALLAAGGLFAWWPHAPGGAHVPAASSASERPTAKATPFPAAQASDESAVATASPAPMLAPVPQRVQPAASIAHEPVRDTARASAERARPAARVHAPRTHASDVGAMRPPSSHAAVAASPGATSSADALPAAPAVESLAASRPPIDPRELAPQPPKSVPQPAAQAQPLEPVARPEPESTPPAAASAPVALDEAGLLQRARRLARDKPTEALRLLDEHRRRFGQGMLAPEREVLAIEILRAEGRSTEANRRMQAFRARYPDSVYLERLEH